MYQPVLIVTKNARPTAHESNAGRLDDLDAWHLGRLAGRVLKRLKETPENWACRGGRGSGSGSGVNTSGDQPVPERIVVGWRRQGSSGSPGSSSGDSGEATRSAGGDAGTESGGAGVTSDCKEVNLSVREARLWGKLSELRDLDSLAAFPAGLGKDETKLGTTMLYTVQNLEVCSYRQYTPSRNRTMCVDVVKAWLKPGVVREDYLSTTTATYPRERLQAYFQGWTYCRPLAFSRQRRTRERREKDAKRKKDHQR